MQNAMCRRWDTPGILRGLQDEHSSLTMTNADLEDYRLQSINASDADRLRAQQLIKTNEQLKASARVAETVVTSLEDMLLGKKVSLAQIGQELGKTFVDALLEALGARQALTNLVQTALGGLLNLVGLGAPAAAPAGGVQGPVLEGPPMAEGGPVLPGYMYQWQEAGKEYFIPGSPGTVVPESKLGGQRPVVVNMNVQTPDASSFVKSAQEVQRTVVRAFDQAQRRLV